MSEIEHAYLGSDADKTRAVYQRLMECGGPGRIAVNLLRASKNSERAKLYKSGRSSRAAYGTKDWAIGELIGALAAHADEIGIVWGWGRDEKTIAFEDVLYVDIPSGQVSFHVGYRGSGPEYRGEWDGVRGEGARRIIAFANSVLTGEPIKKEDHHVERNRTEGTSPAGTAGTELREPQEQKAFDL